MRNSRIPLRGSAILLALLLALVPSTACAEEASAAGAAAPALTAQAAILIEASTGRVLLERNADQALPMASTTKIMTAWVALKYGKLSDVVTVSPLAHGTEGSSMYLDAGERQTLENLLYGLMLKSGNDAAVAIAQHIGGSVEGFTELMNREAEQLGCTSTHFANPNGLPAEGHVTTARELSMIAAEAMKNPVFQEIVATRKKNVPWDGKAWDRVMGNGNKLLATYEGANGIKTGYTKQAGRCLVAGAHREGMQLIAVVLNCGPMYEECAAMFDWAFERYEMKPILVSGAAYGDVAVEHGVPDTLKAVADASFFAPLAENEKAEITLELPDILAAPVRAGDAIGRAVVRVGDEELGEAALLADRDAAADRFGAYLRDILRRWLSFD